METKNEIIERISAMFNQGFIDETLDVSEHEIEFGDNGFIQSVSADCAVTDNDVEIDYSDMDADTLEEIAFAVEGIYDEEKKTFLSCLN